MQFLIRSVLILILFPSIVIGQSGFLNNEVKWMFDAELSDSTLSSIKSFSKDPFIFEEIPKDTIKTKYRIVNWALNKDLVAVSGDNYSVVINPIYDFSKGNQSYFSSKRGFFLRGGIGSKFRWHSLYYENYTNFQGKTKSLVDLKAVAPGEAEVKFLDNGYDYAVANGGFEYQFSKYFNLFFGHGKNFIGDGYRSLLLSDAANSYPYLKSELSFGRFKYTSIVAEFTDFKNDLVVDGLKRKKYGSFHYFDLAITKKIKIGLFESVIWAGDSSSRSSIELNYLNPFVIFRPIEYSIGSPDNMLLGFNGSWDISNSMKLYGQAVLDEFHSKNLLENPSWWANKYGYQIGLKLHKFKSIPNLVIVAEHNAVRPFTYSHKEVGSNYGHNYEALAHPYGANFREFLAIVNYRKNRVNFNTKILYIKGGQEAIDSVSVGTDIFKENGDRAEDEGYSIGAGVKYDQFVLDSKLSFIINYNYLLMFDIGYRGRMEMLEKQESTNHFVYFGLRTSLFNSYYDY